MDYYAKKAIWEYDSTAPSDTQQFPLEPICVILEKNKMTCDKGEALRFWVHKQLTKESFHQLSILFTNKFDIVD
jgi:hypothetical protein